MVPGVRRNEGLRSKVCQPTKTANFPGKKTNIPAIKVCLRTGKTFKEILYILLVCEFLLHSEQNKQFSILFLKFRIVHFASEPLNQFMVLLLRAAQSMML